MSYCAAQLVGGNSEAKLNKTLRPIGRYAVYRKDVINTLLNTHLPIKGLFFTENVCGMISTVSAAVWKHLHDVIDDASPLCPPANSCFAPLHHRCIVGGGVGVDADQSDRMAGQVNSGARERACHPRSVPSFSPELRRSLVPPPPPFHRYTLFSPELRRSLGCYAFLRNTN